MQSHSSVATGGRIANYQAEAPRWSLPILHVPAFDGPALCAETDPEIFYPEQGASTAPAKMICGRCEVKSECLDYAIERGEKFGVWGGLSERERRKLLKGA